MVVQIFANSGKDRTFLEANGIHNFPPGLPGRAKAPAKPSTIPIYTDRCRSERFM